MPTVVPNVSTHWEALGACQRRVGNFRATRPELGLEECLHVDRRTAATLLLWSERPLGRQRLQRRAWHQQCLSAARPLTQ